MRVAVVAAMAAVLVSVAVSVRARECNEDRGFLDNPPVFIVSEPDVPMTGLGATIPPPGQILPDFDLTALESHGFRSGGDNVQPLLHVKFTTIRIGALRGFNDGWAAGVSIPWRRIQVWGEMGGQPSTAVNKGLGNIMLAGKKQVWSRENRRMVASVAIELPTGKDSGIFDQNNAVTDAFYQSPQGRIPAGWQPGNGSFNGYLALSYERDGGRLSQTTVLAGKLYGTGDEDVKIGNTFIAAWSATYGLTRAVAASLGFTLRTQGDDQYPNAPPPGIGQPALVGVTTHGTTLYVDPSVRFRIMGRVTVGAGVRCLLSEPANGLVPRSTFSLIFYPDF